MIQGRDPGDENDYVLERRHQRLVARMPLDEVDRLWQLESGWSQRAFTPGELRGATFTADGREWRLCGCELTGDGWVWRCPEHKPEGA